MKIAKLAAILLVAGCLNGMARAQVIAPLPEAQWATEAQVAKFIDAMRLDQQMESIQTILQGAVQQVSQGQIKSFEDRLGGRSLTEEQKEKVAAFQQRLIERALKLYPMEELKASISVVYRKYVSREDMDAIIAFYQAPAGQRLLDAQPAMVQEYMSMALSHIQERVQSFEKESAAEAEALAKSLARE